jgi:hypothetical protein
MIRHGLTTPGTRGATRWVTIPYAIFSETLDATRVRGHPGLPERASTAQPDDLSASNRPLPTSRCAGARTSRKTKSP